MRKTYVAPSILSADFADMAKEIGRVNASGADLVHCDVMDGMFVPNITFGPKMVADIRRHTALPLDVHMMVQNPERYVEAFVKAGADYVTIHVEACPDVAGTLAKIKSLGAKCGVVLNPATEVSEAAPYLALADMVLLMSVNPGFGGQKFILPVMDKIRALRGMIESSGREILLEIDGGVNADNVAEIRAAGADVIVAGSFFFGADDLTATARLIRGA